MPTNITHLTDLIQDTLSTHPGLFEQIDKVELHRSPNLDAYRIYLILHEDGQWVAIDIDHQFLLKVCDPTDRAFTLEKLALRCEREIKEQVTNKALEEIVLSPESDKIV